MTHTPVRAKPEEPPAAAVFALSVLVLIALCGPWAIGVVSPEAIRLATLCGLGAAGLALALQTRGGAVVPPGLAAALLTVVALGACQLVPLPGAILSKLAPGPNALWFPADPSAASVLGDASRTISVAPDATALGLLLWSALVALACLAAPAASSPRGAALVATAVAFSGMTLSVYAIIARATFGPLLYGRFPVPTVMPFGPFVSKNHFAGYVAMAAIMTLGLVFHLMERESRGSALSWAGSPRAYRIVLALGALAVMVGAVLLSRSRGGAVSLAAGLLVAAVVRRHPGASAWKPILAVVLLAGIVVVLLPPEAKRRLRTLVAVERADRASSFRFATWSASARAAAMSPFVGYGIGAFGDALPPYKRENGSLRIEHAENDYVEWLVETGGAGVIAGIVLLVVLVRQIRRGPLTAGPGRSLQAGAIGGILALAVHSAVDFNTRIPSNAALALCLVALAAGSTKSRLHPVVTAATAAALGVAAVWCFTLPIEAPPTPREDVLRASALADVPARELRLTRASRQLTEVLRRRPADAEAWFLLAWTCDAKGRRVEAAAFARRAIELDPARTTLRERAEELARMGATAP